VARVTIIFGALTALLWLADCIDTPDSVPAIKPLFWACAFCFAALLLRALFDGLRKPRRDPRRGD
jgi:hypothetical protein